MNQQTHSCVKAAADNRDSPIQQIPRMPRVLWSRPVLLQHSWKIVLALHPLVVHIDTFILVESIERGKHKGSIVWDIVVPYRD